MLNLFRNMTKATVFVYVYVVLTQFFLGVYVAGQVEPPPTYTVIQTIAFFWVMGWWLRDDSQQRQIPWIYDMGFFLYLAWPFVMPYYLLKSRGAKGLIVMLGFVAVAFCASVAGLATYVLLGPRG